MCYFLKNTNTLGYYLQYPGNTTYDIGGHVAEILPSKNLKSKREARKQRISQKPTHNSEEDARPQVTKNPTQNSNLQIEDSRNNF